MLFETGPYIASTSIDKNCDERTMITKNRMAVFLVSIAVSVPATTHAMPTTYDGITFPGGDASFADALIDLTFGTPAPTNPNFTDGTAALGPPDYPGNPAGSVSLGAGGTITLQFTDNSLTGSDSDDNDLHIFEIGPDIEDTDVWISTDGSDFLSVGRVTGSTSSIDIDPFLAIGGLSPFTQFSYVRLQDVAELDGTSGSTVGADIDAVGAITSAPPVDVPEPTSLGLFGLGVAVLGFAARRKSRL